MLCGALNGRKFKKRGYICIRLADSLCYTVETNTMLQSDYMQIKANTYIKKKGAGASSCSSVLSLILWK